MNTFEYSERESNPHGHYWPQDFKSGVSTYSTIRALFCGANVQLKKQTAKCKLQNCEQKPKLLAFLLDWSTMTRLVCLLNLATNGKDNQRTERYDDYS